MATTFDRHHPGPTGDAPIELLPPDRHHLGPAGDAPIEPLPPDPIRAGMQVADIDRTTMLGRWFDDALTRCGEWASHVPPGHAPAAIARCPAGPGPTPGPRRQELQVFRQVWLPVEEVVSYLATRGPRLGHRRPRLECPFADLRRPADRALWTVEGRLRPRWGPTSVRVRVSIYGLAGPRTVLDLVPLVTRRRLRTRRFARAGMRVLEALREEIRLVVPERIPATWPPPDPGPT